MVKKRESSVLPDEVLLYTVKETTEILKLCERSVYNLFDNGSLDRVKIGNATRVTAASVRRLAEAR